MWRAINQISNGYSFSNKKGNVISELADSNGNAITEQKPMADLLNSILIMLGVIWIVCFQKEMIL